MRGTIVFDQLSDLTDFQLSENSRNYNNTTMSTFRSCIFPFLIRGGKDTPFFPFAMAFLFCVSNGFLQSGHLLYHANYGPLWYTRPHIYIGKTVSFANSMSPARRKSDFVISDQITLKPICSTTEANKNLSFVPV